MKNRLIYVVDDEQKIRDLIKTYLIREGYDVQVFGDGQTAYDSFLALVADMLIIDIMMPGMDGYSLCNEIRKISKVPIIMVSAKDDEIDRILGLELGSDDYIAKPFSPREMVARVKSIFRRIKDEPEKNDLEQRECMSCKDVMIFPEERRIVVDNKEVEFTTKEYDLLLFLVKNKNKAFNREQLIRNIWGYDYLGDNRTIDDLIKRIRKKLSDVNSEIEITTVWGYGYKICE